MVNPELSSKLIEATERGELLEVRRLLDAGADIEERSLYGHPPLMIAATRGYPKIVSLLLSHEANIHATAWENETALHHARDREITWILLSQGASLEARDEFGQTPLHWAIFNFGRLETLLNWGAEIEAEDDDGYTPIWRAIDEGSEEAVATLVLRGASVGLMRIGTIGRKVYYTNMDIFLVLSKMMWNGPGFEIALRKQRPEVFAELLQYQTNNTEFIKILELKKRVRFREDKK